MVWCYTVNYSAGQNQRLWETCQRVFSTATEIQFHPDIIYNEHSNESPPWPFPSCTLSSWVCVSLSFSWSPSQEPLWFTMITLKQPVFFLWNMTTESSKAHMIKSSTKNPVIYPCNSRVRAEKTLNLQPNLIRSCSVHVLRAVMRLLKLDMGQEEGRLVSWDPPFLPTPSIWNHITDFLQAAISISRLERSTLMWRRDSVFSTVQLNEPGIALTSCALRHECAQTKGRIISRSSGLRLWRELDFVWILFEFRRCFAFDSVISLSCYMCRPSLRFTFT